MTMRDPGGFPLSDQPHAATTGKDPADPSVERAMPPAPPAWKDQASDIGRKATDGARQLASSAQSTAKQRLDRGKQDAALTLSSVASTLLTSGSHLRDDDQPMAGEYVERAARQIERVANYMQSADVREMVSEVEDFARRRPAVFIGSAFAAGLLAARFLKNSREGQHRSDDRREAQRLMEREVPPTVSMEPGRATGSDPEAWPGTS